VVSADTAGAMPSFRAVQDAYRCWSGALEPERRIELLTYALRVRCSAV
jgi:hypothetical protein